MNLKNKILSTALDSIKQERNLTKPEYENIKRWSEMIIEITIDTISEYKPYSQTIKSLQREFYGEKE